MPTNVADNADRIFRRLSLQVWLLVLLWTAGVAGSLLWNLREQSDKSLLMAHNSAELTFQNDVLYRRWVARQGGVYVPVTERTPPNPYLKVPTRDVATSSGLSLTLINPAYMTRLVHEMGKEATGTRGHITSLRPIRPENRPDAWEAAALRAFEKGEPEFSSVETIDGAEYLRLMRPFLTEEDCLKCHAAQGYKAGDIRGGISISVPLAPLRAFERPATAILALAHMGMWIAGLAGIAFSKRLLGRELFARQRAERERRITVVLLQRINEGQGVRELVRAALAFFRKQSGCEAVGIRLREGEDYPYYETHGFPPEFVQLESQLCARDGAGQVVRDASGCPVIECMCGNVICGRLDPSKPFFTPYGSFWSNGTTRLLASTSEADRQARTRNRCNGEGYESVALLPLRAGDERLGLLQLNDRRQGMFSAETIAQWERLAGYLAVGLAKARAEEALRESQPRLTAALEIAQLSVWEYRQDTGLIGFDKRSGELFGTGDRREMAIEEFLAFVHEEDRQRVAADIRSAFDPAGDGLYDTEYRIVRPDGAMRWLAARGHAIFTPEGQGRRLLRAVGTVMDITARKQTEEALLRAKENLELRVEERTAQIRALALELTQAEQRERKRLAQVLHDHLQQLLVGAKLGLGVASKRVAGEDLQRSLEAVSGLLDESIRASKSLTVELSPPILHEAGLAAALHWLSRWMGEKHGLAVEVSAETEIEADREGVCMLLFQCVRELLFNVVKHSGAKAAQVVLSRTNGQARIVVSDRGAGLDPARAQALDSAGGFGLFSIRERLRLVGGRMEVDSAPGQGVRVSLAAPLPEPSAAPAAEGASPAAVPEVGRTRGGVETARGGKIHILVADDHAIVRQGLMRLLRAEADFEVVGEAADGEMAVEMAGRLRPDIVTMDLNMPKLNGIEATQRLAAEAPGVRVIGLSMFEEADRAAAMLEAGAVAYLHKGGASEDLIAAIRAHCPARAK